MSLPSRLREWLRKIRHKSQPQRRGPRRDREERSDEPRKARIKVRAVSYDFIDWINESAKSTYPEEFICFHAEEDGIIREIILASGVNGAEGAYGSGMSTINDWMTPIDYHKSGTAHSHPGFSLEPSDDDLDFFRHYGGIHIITCEPYDRQSWKAYDSCGRPVDLPMVD